MGKQQYVVEASKIAAKRPDGTYRVRIITEGEGSTGVYSREMLEREQSYFSGSPSFMNHPIDPTKPHERDVTTISGRIVGETEYEVDENGLAALYGTYKPDARWADFVAEYQDILGLSIFAGAEGEQRPDGKLVVENFVPDDPYRSVDIVVAAGRGGRFERAQESFRAIESAQGNAPANKPGAASAQEREGKQMDLEKEVAALKTAVESLTNLLTTFVTESKDAAEKARQAEADANAEKVAVDEAVEKALESYAEKVKSVEEADILPSAKDALLESAKKGEDITSALESAIETKKEALTVVEAARENESGTLRYVAAEAATKSGKATDALPKGW